MPFATPEKLRPTGSRRLTLTMLAVRDQADHFQGVPRGTAKPFQYLGLDPYVDGPLLARGRAAF